MSIGDLLASATRPLPYFRGRQRILNMLVPKNGSRTAAIHGVPMRLLLSEIAQRDVYMGTYEPKETKILNSLLKAGATFVDAGANIGYYTALAAMRVGTAGRVFAFEPHLPLFRSLADMFRGMPQVTCLPIALGEDCGTIPLYVPPASYCNMDPSIVEYTRGMQKVEVSVRPLDDVLDEWGVQKVHMLKVDVEGCESQLFRGCVRTFRAGAVDNILCEINPALLKMAGSSPQELIQLLGADGFTPVTPCETANLSNVLFTRST